MPSAKVEKSGRAPGLVAVRLAIDGLDDGLVVLLAARARLVRLAGRFKSRAGLQGRDDAREQHVRRRAEALAMMLGLAPETAIGVLSLAIGDAHRVQGLAVDLDQGADACDAVMIANIMNTRTDSGEESAHSFLRWLPPPRRIAPLLRMLPRSRQKQLLERAMARVLAGPMRDGALDFMVGRRLGIEVDDLGLCWVVGLQGSQLVVIDTPAEATVRGTATDLLLLAGRLEDADTLFFQRRLVLTGDVELGLTARNLLDRLPWEKVPLGLRILLNRGARFARAARSAHQAGTPDSP